MPREIEDILPILAIEHDCIVSKQGDITVVFEAVLPEIFTMSEAEFEGVHQAFVKAVRVLPRHTVFHKQDWFTEATYIADHLSREHSFLSRSSERFFHECPYLHHRCFIMLTKKPAGRRASSSLMSTLLKKNLVPTETLNPSMLQEFLDAAGQFARIVEDGKVVLRRVRQESREKVKVKRSETFTANSAMIKNDSPKLQHSGADTAVIDLAGLIEQYLTLSTNNSFLGDISFEDGIRIGDKHCSLFTLADATHLPSSCAATANFEKYSTDRTRFNIGFASPLGQLLSCNHIYNQYIFVDDGQKMLQHLESKRLRLQSLAAYSRENLIVRDATNDFLNEAISQQRLPVKSHFNILCWTDDRKELKDLRNLVSSALARMNAVPKQELSGAPQIFWAGTPGNAADFPMNDSFDTFAEQACCFLNVETNYRSSVSPFGIRLGDRLTGRPLHVDISDEPMKIGLVTNRNKFILGPSGSGKSFFTNHMLRSYCEQGTHVVVVDVGHSYRGLCSLVKGYYFTYDEKHPIRFNPFFIGADDVLDTEKKESIKTLLLALWKKDNETFRRSEYVALSNALQLYYDLLAKTPQMTPGFDSFYEFLQTSFLEQLQADKVQQRDFDVANFLYVLRPYYRGGEFDYLLNASENLDLLKQPFIVFELDNIKDHPILFPVVTLIIMEVFISKMRKLKGVRKMILIEEAWKAIAREGMAEYIKYLFKTVRKFFGEAVVVTQDIEDIISSPVIKQAIINNADCKILLDQSKYQNKFTQVQELLGLTDKEKALILSMNRSNEQGRNYKEVFILGKVYRVEVSLQEYLAYTTEEADRMRLLDKINKFGSIERGIQALADEWKR